MSMSWMTGVALAGLLGLPPPTNSTQGSQLHGTGPLEHVNIPLGNAVLPPLPLATGGTVGRPCPASVELDKGTLEVVRRCAPAPLRAATAKVATGKELVGTRFYAPLGGELVPLVITGVRPHERPQDVMHPEWEYEVMHEVKPGGCDGPKSAVNKQCVPLCQATKNRHALAVPHAWSMSGELLRNPGYFTFACVPDLTDSVPSLPERGGVIAKCIDWGFPPWTASRAPEAQQAALQLHQACVRMATADYCGEGRTNTIEGTPLAFYDLSRLSSEELGQKAPETLVDKAGNEVLLEAVWAVDDCGKVEPLCLGKKRWASLALDAACLDRNKVESLAQRRLGGMELPQNACEGQTLQAMKDRKALLVSYSRIVDKLLVLFGDPGTGAFLTTSNVALEGDRIDTKNPRYKPALPDTARYPFIRVEGPILSHTLSKRVVVNSQGLLKPLFRCRNKEGGYVLTNAADQCGQAPFAGYTLDVQLEGYVFSSLMSPSGDKFNPEDRWLRVWKHKDSQRFAVSTERPEGYEQMVRSLGYLPTVGMLPARLVSARTGGFASQFPVLKKD